MKKDTKLLMVLVGAVLITSGCMEGGESEASTDGVSVSEFNVNPNPSFGGQNTNVRLELESAGDSTAESVRAYIFGPVISNNDDGTWSAPDGQILEFSELPPATENRAAIPRRDSIRLVAPELEQGRENPYSLNAQILYGYSTTSSTDLQIMSQERFQESGTVQTSTETTNTNGPVQLEIQETTPLVFSPEEGDRTKEFCTYVRNRGSGLAFHPNSLPANSETDIAEEDRSRVRLSVEDVGNIIFTEEKDNEIKEGDTLFADVFVDGEGYHCFTMTAARLGDVTSLEQTANIEINAEYGYREETSTSVTVEGRGTGSTGSGTETDASPSDDDSENNDENQDGSIVSPPE